jgi:hypothetical protein
MKKINWSWVEYIAIIILAIGLIVLMSKLAHPANRTEISVACVENNFYSKVANVGRLSSDIWDKSIEYAGQDLTIWNEIYIIPDRVSADLTYSSNFNSYRAMLSCNYNIPVSKIYSVEVGGGVYAENGTVFPCFMANNRFRWNIFIFKTEVFNQLYFPVGKAFPLEMKNDLIVKLNLQIIYFKMLYRSIYENNKYSDYKCGGIEIEF